MTAFEKFWARIVGKNPKLADEATRCTLATSELKRLLQKSFHAGEASGMETERALGKLRSPGSLFGHLFDR